MNVRTRKIIGHGKSYSLHRNSWLRKFGIYYALDQSITSRNTRITSVCLRMDSPSFLIPKSLALRLRFLHSTSSANNISILPGYIQVQNRIPITSPFMLACQMGNTSLIRQYLDQDRELLHSRTMCAGRTPLMVSTTLRFKGDAKKNHLARNQFKQLRCSGMSSKSWCESKHG